MATVKFIKFNDTITIVDIENAIEINRQTKTKRNRQMFEILCNGVVLSIILLIGICYGIYYYHTYKVTEPISIMNKIVYVILSIVLISTVMTICILINLIREYYKMNFDRPAFFLITQFIN
jgi:uncharacterized integral membrane protein